MTDLADDAISPYQQLINKHQSYLQMRAILIYSSPIYCSTAS